MGDTFISFIQFVILLPPDWIVNDNLHLCSGALRWRRKQWRDDPKCFNHRNDQKSHIPWQEKKWTCFQFCICLLYLFYFFPSWYGFFIIVYNISPFISLQSKNADFRRKWDKDEYEKLAQKRIIEEREKKDGLYFAYKLNVVVVDMSEK